MSWFKTPIFPHQHKSNFFINFFKEYIISKESYMKHTTIQMKTHQKTWTHTQTQWQTQKMRHTNESYNNPPHYHHHHHTCGKQNLTQSKTKDMSHAYLIFKKTQVHRIILVALHQLLTTYLAICLHNIHTNTYAYIHTYLHLYLHTYLLIFIHI